MSNSTTPLNLSDDSVEGVAIWISIFAVVSFIAMLLFEYVRRKKSWQKVFYSRILFDSTTSVKIPEKLFEWASLAYHTPEETIELEAGLDAVMFLRFMAMCVRLFGTILVLMVAVLIPVNFLSPSADMPKNILSIADSLTYFSIAKVKDGSSFLWIHVACAYVVSGLAYYHILHTYRAYIESVTTSLLNPESEVQELKLRTVLIKHLPSHLTEKSRLTGWINDLGIGEVETVSMNTEQNHDLLTLIASHKRLVGHVEYAYMKWAISIYRQLHPKLFRKPWASASERIKLMELEMTQEEKVACESIKDRLRPKKLIGAKMVDTIKYYTPLIKDLEKKIEEKRNGSRELLRRRESFNQTLKKIYEVYDDYGSAAPSAFVTFKDIKSASIMVQMLLTATPDSYHMEVRSAPAPIEIVWNNLSRSVFRQKFIRWMIGLLSFVLCAFWIVPTYYVSSLAILGVPELEKVNPKLGFVIQTVAPPLLIMSSNNIMPFILDYFTSLQSIGSRTELQKETLKKYFYFLLMNVYFVFTLLTSALGILDRIFSDPLLWVKTVSISFPSGASFFINYLILCLAVYPIELLRIPALIYFSFRKLFAFTPRELIALTADSSSLNYGFITPLHILIFVVVLCYSVISPLVILPGVVYFAIGWLVYKNQLLYVYVKRSEGDGSLWILIYNRCIFGLYISQFFLAGILSAKEAPYAAIWAGLLLPITYGFNRYCFSLFHNRDKYIPLETSVQGAPVDLQAGVVNTTNSPASNALKDHIDEMNRRTKLLDYRAPVLTEPLPYIWVPAYVDNLYQAEHHLPPVPELE